MKTELTSITKLLLGLLLWLGLWTIPHSLKAQDKNWLQEPVMITLAPMPMGEALEAIEKTLAIRFSYDPQIVPLDKLVSLKTTGQSLEVILKNWLQGSGLTYRALGDQIVLYQAASQNAKTINGFIRERGSLEPLPYARVIQLNSKAGAIANQYGYFSLSLDDLPARLVVSHLGYRSDTMTVTNETPAPLGIKLTPQAISLKVVQIEAESMIEAEEAGRFVLGLDYLQSVPTFLGERDVVKALQYLPGVQRANDGNSGLFVRGGNSDQNLILLDEAPIYNVNHLFGFFSVFNGDAVQSVEFIKGGFPAHYGGRLSSVVAVTTREGSKEKWGADGAIGITSSRLTIGGPILNKKGSLLLSARRTYWDLLVRPFIKVSSAQTDPFFFFHDYNAKLTYNASPKDKITLSLYSSWDRYGLLETNLDNDQTRTGFSWQNLSGTLRWNRVISPKHFMNTSLFTTNYGVRLFNRSTDQRGDQVGVQRLSTGSEMTDIALKHDFYWYPNAKHEVRFGGILFQHIFTPNRLRAFRENFGNTTERFDLDFKQNERYFTQEAALYLEDRWALAPQLKLELGLRLSAYTAEGQFWANPEPRIKLQYQPASNHQLEVSTTRMTQYIHQISNSGLALPIDVWVPSTASIRPQESWQFALAWGQRYPAWGLSIMTELYYKKMDNIIGYREGGSFFDLDLYNLRIETLDWQNLVIQGEGESYGLEIFTSLKGRQYQMSLSYTWSYTQYLFAARNGGQAFAPRFDRRHSLAFLYQHRFTERLELNAAWTFATGNPFPLPLSQAYLTGHEEIKTPGNGQPDVFFQFSQLDEFRSPLYHRLDASLKIKAKPKTRRWDWTYYWELGAYNLYNRLNPTFYLLEAEVNSQAGTQRLRLQENSLFFLTPSVSFNFSF
ncbi:MAG: TonB-dependent receptor [Bacteroidia bacterium]